jgi:4-oxalomesaconate tautomerase
MDPRQPEVVARASLLRTARLLMRGDVLIPGDIWKD